jgi:hypothetical protein
MWTFNRSRYWFIVPIRRLGTDQQHPVRQELIIWDYPPETTQTYSNSNIQKQAKTYANSTEQAKKLCSFEFIQTSIDNQMEILKQVNFAISGYSREFILNLKHQFNQDDDITHPHRSIIQ